MPQGSFCFRVNRDLDFYDVQFFLTFRNLAQYFFFCKKQFFLRVLWRDSTSGPEVIKLFPCSTQLSMKFIQHINVKMPTTVGILTFISMINTTSESLKARIYFSILVVISGCSFMLS